MQVKWKKNKNFKPEVVLKKIDDMKTISEDNKLSYSGFEYHEVMATIRNMIEFPKSTSFLDQQSVVSTAISNVAIKRDLNKADVITEINELVRQRSATREHEFSLLTSVSIRKPYPMDSLEVEGCSIKFFEGDFPQKYTGRSEKIAEHSEITDGTPDGYSKVIIDLKAKTERGAATKALRAFDIVRSIFCLFSNFSMEIIGNEWKPINVIRLGGAHTIHKISGELASEVFWFEPNFVRANICQIKSPEIMAKNVNHFLERIEGSAYGETIKEALLRYVRALDEKDQNVALIRLWGALEELTAPGESNYDLVTRRTSFLFAEKDYHKQVLEHLRDYRNRNVHSGDQTEKAKTNCFQLQFYVYHLILFHIRNAQEFTNLDEANNFLDLSSDIDVLKNKKRIIEKAIKFVE